MSAQLQAAMKLTLEDLVSAQLAKIEAMLDRIAKVGQSVSLEKLTGAASPLNAVGSAAQKLVEQVVAIGETAQESIPSVDALVESVGSIGEGAGGAAAAAEGIAAVGEAATTSGEAVGGLLARMRALAAVGFENAASAIGGAVSTGGGFIRGTPGRIAEVGNAAGELGGSAMEAGMAGFGIVEPFKMASEYENTLRHMAITAGLTGASVDKFIHDRGLDYEHLALSTATKSADVANAGRFLSTTGMKQSTIDQLLPSIAMASTAYDTPVADAGQMVFSLSELLKIKPDQMGATLSAMALAGKMSHFSFADMSTFLPEIASRSAALGIVGRQGADETAAMLATARRHAGTSGEAATNMKQFLTDITAPRASLHFRKQNIDLGEIVHKAMAAGINPAIAVINKLHQIAPTADPVELGKLFGNQQSQTFVQAMLQDHAFYKQVLDRLQGANPQTIQSDFTVAQEGKQAELERTFEKTIDLGRRVGDAFQKPLDSINGSLGWLVQKIEWLDQKSPGTFDKIVGGLGSVVAFTAGLSLLGHALKLVNTGLAVFGLGMNASAIGVAFTAGRLGLLALGFETVANSALLAGGIFIIIPAAIAAAVYLIYEYWKPITAFFANVWTDIKQGFNDFVAWLESWLGGAGGAVMKELGAIFDFTHDHRITVGGHAAGPAPAADTATPATIALHHTIDLHVTSDNPGVKTTATVRSTRTSTAAPAPNRGPTLGRP